MMFYDSKIKNFVDESTNRLGTTEHKKQEVRESQQEILNRGGGGKRERRREKADNSSLLRLEVGLLTRQAHISSKIGEETLPQ